jgi:hypothetical protein
VLRLATPVAQDWGRVVAPMWNCHRGHFQDLLCFGLTIASQTASCCSRKHRAFARPRFRVRTSSSINLTAGGLIVTAYRVYCLDGVNRFILAEWIDAEGDEEALRLASTITAGLNREVWERDRLVGRLVMDPGSGSDPPQR